MVVWVVWEVMGHGEGSVGDEVKADSGGEGIELGGGVRGSWRER